ncbi:MAG: hypothetical protein K0R14_266 [Burkholderiales bacterium]|jgi:hypothetical protein|nr:hypothetical protein [Burkholderiales bacterium]
MRVSRTVLREAGGEVPLVYSPAKIITIMENNPVSDSTINATINKKLYPKFEVFNISQLVEKAIMLDLIPLLLK